MELKLNAVDASHKAALDALLLKLPGVTGGEVTGLPAYFVGDRMFACIYGGAVGIRVSVATATELQFARGDAAPFQPKGRPSTREWIQIARANSADYAQDLELFKASIEFVKTAKSR